MKLRFEKKAKRLVNCYNVISYDDQYLDRTAWNLEV